MTTLFKDSETFQKDRPLYLPRSHFKKLCDKLAEGIIEEGFSSKEASKISDDLYTFVDFNSDGYEIAKQLENHCTSYSFSSRFVEHLDFFMHEKDDALDKLVKQWIKAHNPQPKFKEKDHLLINTNFGHIKKGMKVYVNRINKDKASYLIHEDKDYKGGYVLPYEKIDKDSELITS